MRQNQNLVNYLKSKKMSKNDFTKISSIDTIILSDEVLSDLVNSLLV